MKTLNIIREGFFRKIKTKIGHSLPEPVRSGMTKLAVAGKIQGSKADNDKYSENRYREFNNKLKNRNVPRTTISK